ncbi:lytic transglycosylase domain-containing protein [Streptomyces sp. NBC_01474]|uniref:lytic transglycosylase domain-containing protein n=1 Tax=unclassified Streptomyces TaxID=2593676 RepID=UPI002DD9D2A1|nr:MULTISPECIES: lytic transglycosylase domain-containing protein [unclassified Streptomyces]WSD98862.1 lytic transglycosylase domain-containing protein [Streptomyces sp. NBC_01474]
MAALFGKRLRRSAMTTAVAAAAVAALSASQAPGLTDTHNGRQSTADATPSPGDSATGNSPYYTDLPPLNSPTAPPSTGPGSPSGTGAGAHEAGIPATVLDAYKKAEAELAATKPGCNLPWQLLAAIGKVESGQARGGNVDANGTTLKPILGPVLNGNGFARITDTDNGAYDGDTTHDRAVGPMQFIPSTWEWSGRDGNGDGKKDPNNIYDAALAAGHYLCRGDRDLSQSGGLHAAILSYNHSQEYLNTVLTWLEYYRKGTHEVPDGTGVQPGGRSDGSPSPSPSSPGTTSPSPGASKPPKPSKPGGSPGTDPSKPGGGGSTSPTPPTPAETVAHIEDAGTGTLNATAGDAFAEPVAVRTENAAGKGVGTVKVKLTVVGDTDLAFSGGFKSVTVVTDSTGKATAPPLRAGEDTGEFTVRATVVDRKLPGLDYTATVSARQADALTRTGDTELTCEAGGQFADPVQVRATYKGDAADGVATTATLIKSKDDATENDKGPYFKDADGKAIRTLKGLKTDGDGRLQLPRIYADDATGTFLLRIDTTGGATLTIELKVTAAGATATPSASPSAT